MIRVLRDDMLGSIDPRAPLRIIKHATFKGHGRVPRSNDMKTVLLSEAPKDAKVLSRAFCDAFCCVCDAVWLLTAKKIGAVQIVFISHRWLRPWHTKVECEAKGHEWAGMAHPDDAAGTKHKLICDGLEKLAKDKGWDLDRVYLWIDYAGARLASNGLGSVGHWNFGSPSALLAQTRVTCLTLM